ncbi:DUF1573 domain-containing protein [uncultured Aquimarina sp.]|uniref:DUF1573 domain-containing protein n=1 Tax=uncultured Aquimarina sp. TaxID=575652 RepID=UPI0026217F13|nr:DUF1573 domain-containing protein [uncultured Aquimarina sp.]
MKKANTLLILLMIASGFMISCTHQTKENPTATTIAMQGDPTTETKNAVPVMTFTETEFDFGTVTEGDILKHTFSFTNTGNAPLVIVNAKGSCGCTVSDWPKEPIAPGGTKEMQVTFNTNGKPNLQNKQVTITTNTTAGKHILKIKAMVTPKAKSVVSGAPISK